MSRHILGIDLGTTHCALASAALDDEASRPRVFEIAQLVGQATLEERPLLPSFHYSAHESDGVQALPWDAGRKFVVGEYARSRGADAPARVVSSAKSWLCHPGVDRRAKILPQGAPDDVEKISPVGASQKYLEHLKEAWVAKQGHSDLSQDEVVLTVPASFDAAARDLTVEAALAAGFVNLTLLEEPQAALYAWIEALGDQWRKHLRVGDVILVVDVGGGTTDFSAIAVVERAGNLELVRIAVGDHILLGGDNMDLALAHLLREKLNKELDRFQMVALTHAARAAKEKLLSDAALSEVPVTLASRGSRLLGGALKTTLTQPEVTRVLVEGFFPAVNAKTHPAARARVGFTQLGLPYASDAAITKHLASFLTRQADALPKLDESSAAARTLLHPTVVLFNGGVMKSSALRERLVATLNDWLTADGGNAVRVLPAADFDLAVARGAVTFALARKGRGIRIRGGTARAYYVGIESAMPAVPGVLPPVTALCVAPFGMEEGTAIDVPLHELGMVVGEPVRFRFFGSTVRRADTAGTEVERWKEGELDELAPIEICLPSVGRREGDVVPVELRASITEVGTLLLEAVPTAPQRPDEKWRIEFNVRSDS